VQVVGYDNNRQAWLIKYSWGPGFATDGFAWVGFDAPGMCDVRDTYGFVFAPSQRQPADLPRLTPTPGRKDCYTYRAVAGDYPEGLASKLEISLQRLLLDNLDVIQDPSVLPAGTTLLLCGVSPAVAAGAGGGAAVSSNIDEVAALLAIKRVFDPPGTVLRDWQAGAANPCNWTGIICDADSKRVTAINFWDPVADRPRVQLSGQLPSGALLRRLPGLVTLGLSWIGVGGPLPEDWSQLVQLEEVYVDWNRLTGKYGLVIAVMLCLLLVHALKCRGVPCRAVPLLFGWTLSCCAALCQVVSCCAVLLQAVLCNDVLWCAAPFHAVHCRLTWRSAMPLQFIPAPARHPRA
jgi:hypothetical protein